MAKHCRIEREGSPLVEHALLANTFLTRLRGLLGRTALGPDEALVIRPCNMVHMFFMSFAIDVVFCSADGEVLAVCEELRPWQLSPSVPGATQVVELAAGSVRRLGILLQQRLHFSER